jgi:hypothetical protein
MEAKTTELGFVELNMDELNEVTGACRPSFELTATMDGHGHTTIEAHQGNREFFKFVTDGQVSFKETSSWHTQGQARWVSAFAWSNHTFSLPAFFRA